MNRKKAYVLATLIIIAIVFGFLHPSVKAHSGHTEGVTPTSTITQGADHEETVKDVIESIASTQGVSSADDIDCDLMSEDDLERLGEAVMSQMHPDLEEHEAMDEMMGGEGSSTLRDAHIRMAKAYLGCGDFGMGMLNHGSMMTGMQSGLPDYGFTNMDFGVMRYAMGGLLVLIGLSVGWILRGVTTKDGEK